jgi:hypothetical protein
MMTEEQIKAALNSVPTRENKSIELKDGGARGAGRLTLIIRAHVNRVTAE